MSEVIRPGEIPAGMRMRWVKELKRSEAYQQIILPELQRRLDLHTEALRDRKLTAERRAEHVEASHMASELLDFLDEKERALEVALKREAKPGKL